MSSSTRRVTTRTLALASLFLLPASSAIAAVTVVERIGKTDTSSSGTDQSDLEVTGGQILVAATAIDAGADGLLDETVTMTYGGVAMTALATEFRADGEVGSAIFYLRNPPVGTAALAVSYGTTAPISALLRYGGVTLVGIDEADTFGSAGRNVDLSTGITLDDIETGHLTLYAIGAEQGLGPVPPGPLLIDGVGAGSVPGFLNIVGSTFAGSGALIGSLAQQSTGSVTYSHPQAGRQAAAVAVEINSDPVARKLSQAILVEEVLFDDASGTKIASAANSVTSHLFDFDADNEDVETNGAGQLNASLKNNNDFGTNYVDNDVLTDTRGRLFGVMELTWDFQSTLDPAENEEIRISMILDDPRSTFVVAEWEIQREDDDTLTILGNASGTGATDLGAVLLNGGSLSQSETFIAVIELDLPNATYSVHYSNDSGVTFATLGEGALDPGRTRVESLRMTLNNDLLDDNVLIDRVYLARLPEKLLLDDFESGNAAAWSKTVQ